MAELRFNTSYRIVIELGREAGLPLPWFTAPSSLKRILYGCYQVIIAIFVVCKIICAAYAITHNDKFEDIIFGTATLMFTLTGSLITLFYALKGGDFKTLTDSIDKLSEMIKNSKYEQKTFFENLYKNDARILSFCTKLMAISTVVSPVFFVFSVPIAGIIQGNYREKMALPTHCQFELQLHEYYEIFVILEFWGLVFPAIQKLVNEFIMLGLFKTQAGHFKFVSEVLNGIGDESIEVIADARKELIMWIKFHQTAIRNAHALVKFFSPMVVLYYVSIICIVAGGVFYQLNAKDANIVQANFLGLYMVITVIHLYIQCHMADELTSEAENLAQAIYRIPWYTMDSKSKGFLKLIISMAHRPIRIVAYSAPAFTLNKETFVSFMTNTVSAYMGFSKITGMNE